MSEGYFYNLAFLAIATSAWLVSGYFYPIPRKIVRTYIFFWLINSIIIACNFITYDKVFTLKSFLYMSVFFLLGVLGLWMGSLNVRSSHLANALGVKKLNRVSMTVMIGLSSIFIAVGLVEFLSIFKVVISDFGSLRAQFWDEFSNVKPPSLMDAMMAFLGGAAFFTFLTYFSRNSNTPLWTYFFACLIAFVFLFKTFSIGGRASLFFIIFASVYRNFLFENEASEYKLNLGFKRIALYSSIFIGGIYFMVVFPAQRAGIEYHDLDYFLSLRHDARISDYIKELDYTLPGISQLAFATEYFSTPTVKMTNLIEELETSSTYAFGMYSFSVPPKIISMFGGTNYHMEVKLALEDMIAAQGYYATRPWTTAAQDLAVDFGLVGASVMSFLCSFLLAKAYVWGFRTNTSEGYALCSLIGLTLAIFAFKSPFNVTFVANTIFVSFFICLLSRSRIAGKKNK